MVFILIFLYFSIPYTVSEEWTIHVYTGTERYAGTDSRIFIRLFNSKFGDTNEYELTHENMIIRDAISSLKNLFEHGAHDRFRISTEKFEFVEKIHVRRDNFLLVRSDWFLDRIIVQRNRDSTEFLFKCDCWLRTDRSDITLSISSDLRSIEKNNSSKDNQTIVVILIVSIACITCLVCCICECYRRRNFPPIQTQSQESPVVNRYYPQLPEPSAPPLLNTTNGPWRDIQQTLSDCNDTTVVIVQSRVITSTDEPPAYKDLFPD